VGLAEDFQTGGNHFDLATGQVRVGCTIRAATHHTGGLDHIFAAHAVGRGKGIDVFRIEHYLRQTFAVTDIEENHPAMVAATVYPSAQGDSLTFKAGVEVAAIVAAHHDLV